MIKLPLNVPVGKVAQLQGHGVAWLCGSCWAEIRRIYTRLCQASWEAGGLPGQEGPELAPSAVLAGLLRGVWAEAAPKPTTCGPAALCLHVCTANVIMPSGC